MFMRKLIIIVYLLISCSLASTLSYAYSDGDYKASVQQRYYDEEDDLSLGWLILTGLILFGIARYIEKR